MENSKKGYPNGKVNEYYYDTLIYEGNMKKGEYSGKGKAYYLDGTVEYEGEFKNGKYHGKGTFMMKMEIKSIVVVGKMEIMRKIETVNVGFNK